MKLKSKLTKRLPKFIFLLVFLHVLTAANAPVAWHLVKSAPNIKVYTTNVPNYAVKGIRVEVVFDATMQQIITFVMDVNNYSNWIYKCQKSELLKQVSPNEVIYYHITDAPWPVSDRDQVSNSVLKRLPNGVVEFNSHALTNYKKEIEGNVRVNNGKANWTFTPITANKIKGEYELYFDPAGHIPAWILNWFVAEGPYVTMLNMQREINKKKL